MLDVPVTASQRAELIDVLRGTNGTIRGRGRALVLDYRHRGVTDLSDWLLDGQVEWDTTTGDGVERTAAATILDPDGRAGLDGSVVTGTSARVDRYLNLRRDIWLPSHETWASIPIFTGPLSEVTRDGDTISLAAQGKESLAMVPLMTPLSWPKGTRRRQVIVDLLTKGAGEQSLDIPTGTGARLGKAFSVARVYGDEVQTVWAKARAQARVMGLQLFYDARGVARLRKRPVRPVWGFRADDLAGRPTSAESVREIVNTVAVVGGVPKGGKTPVALRRSLPDTHPWSPAALGRNGVGRYLVEQVEDSELVTVKAAEDVAERRLREHETSSVDVTFDALPFPLLEPDDLFRVDADDVATVGRASRATISVVGDLMSVGSVRVYRPRRRR